MFSGVQSILYWSSTSSAVNPDFEWVVLLVSGTASERFKDANDLTTLVWPVRGGQ